MKKGICLFSQGIDSPVAAHIMLKQGLKPDLIHFSNHKKEKIQVTLKKLKNTLEKLHKVKLNLYIFDFRKIQESIKNNCSDRYRCIICKRMMYRFSEKTALEKNLDYLITGENLGQVASQTLDNLFLLDKSVDLPVLRPLLTYDKKEIIEKARKIKTYKISIKNNFKCPFVPKNPVTKGKIEKTKIQESKLDINSLVSI